MESFDVDPLTEFFDAIKNPLTRDRYEKRLALFFKHLQLEGSLKDQARTFAKKAKVLIRNHFQEHCEYSQVKDG